MMRVPMTCPFARLLLTETLVRMAPLLLLAMATPDGLLALALLTMIRRESMLTALHS